MNPNTHTVLAKNGNSALIRSDTDGSEYRRNITHVKKYKSTLPTTNSESCIQNTENTLNSKNVFTDERENKDNDVCTENVTIIDSNTRPVRIRKMPVKFIDCVMT